MLSKLSFWGCTQGMGLSQRQIDACDSFVYIPQYGPGTASLNVTVAASIVLQNFAAWAGYRERERNGTKFVVDERPPRTRAKGALSGLLYYPYAVFYELKCVVVRWICGAVMLTSQSTQAFTPARIFTPTTASRTCFKGVVFQQCGLFTAIF